MRTNSRPTGTLGGRAFNCICYMAIIRLTHPNKPATIALSSLEIEQCTANPSLKVKSSA